MRERATASHKKTASSYAHSQTVPFMQDTLPRFTRNGCMRHQQPPIGLLLLPPGSPSDDYIFLGVTPPFFPGRRLPNPLKNVGWHPTWDDG